MMLFFPVQLGGLTHLGMKISCMTRHRSAINHSNSGFLIICQGLCQYPTPSAGAGFDEYSRSGPQDQKRAAVVFAPRAIGFWGSGQGDPLAEKIGLAFI